MMNKILLIAFVAFFGFESNAQQAWTQKANMPTTARHRTVAFTVGNKGYMGLGHYNSGPNGNIYLEDIWEYDPSTDAWTQKSNFAGGHRYHAVGIGYKDHAFVGTGRDQTAPPSQAYTLETDWWKFDPVANSWTLMAPMPGVGRRGAVAFLIDSLIFVGTGQVSGGYSADFYAYDAENDQWLTGVPPFPGGQRTSAIAFTIDNKGYVGTGGIGCGNTDFYEYKLTTNSWIPRADVGGPIRNEACAFAIGGKGYVLTGDNCSSGTNYRDVWEYDPTTDTWTELMEFPGAARRYMNAFVIGDRAFCGSGTSGVNYSDLWEFDADMAYSSNEELESVEIQYGPNPSTSELNIVLNDIPGVIRLQIYDLQGRIVLERNISNSSSQINIEELKPGMVMCVFKYNDQIIYQDKLIIE